MIIKKIYKKALKNVIIKISYKWPLKLSIQLKNKKMKNYYKKTYLVLKNLLKIHKSLGHA